MTTTVPALPAIAEAPRLELTVEQEAGRPASRTVLVDAERFAIGSHPSNDLVLDDRLVSRFHLVLTQDGGRWRVVDHGSLNGTRVAGVVVRDGELLLPRCRLELGKSIVAARALAAPTAPPPSSDGRFSFGALHGKSPAMRRLFAVLERVVESDVNVLIEGESGTGKELVATEIVRRGARAEQPLIVVDCGAIAPSLIESSLFGHVRGAFTGADRDRVGAFEEASGGTVFLDEIGEMPLEMQPKLLRVIESRSICRVGESRHRAVDVRILAATNRRLEREVNHARFREDLFFRLSVLTVRVPPLRERLEDLPVLIDALTESSPGARALFTPEVLEQWKKYDWPGNVRELRNAIERAAALREIDEAPSPIGMNGDEDPDRVVAAVDLSVPLRRAKEALVAGFERRYIRALLAWADGNVSKAARKASMDRINLHRLIQRYGLRAPRSMKD